MDLKFVGYSISTVSVIFLGIVAWPRPGEPQWQAWAVGLGMAASILGMATRFVSHMHDKQDIKRAAENRPPRH